ncbi:DUF3332 domain-containing protein [Vulgatibacter sp.]|uniref:DUF3332 domain-containing protein n=1 Tax=Vulgatibacter sp. TaxID=1971226 RepID=UPI0035655829
MRRVLLVLSAIALTQSACFGSFAATRSLYQFNKGVSGDKWVRWLAFLGLTIIPAYQLFALGDALIFNSIEFWGGSNPINADASEPRVREVMLADGSTARLVDEGDTLRIEQGDQVLVLQRVGTELTLATGDGTVISTVREGQGGAVEVVDAEGNVDVVRADELAAAGETPAQVTAWALARAGN